MRFRKRGNVTSARGMVKVLRALKASLKKLKEGKNENL
jgi:hypothetical protein